MQRALSMRRLAAVAAISFVLVLAFLAGRVRAGADPTQKAARVAPIATSSPAPENGFAAPDERSFDPPVTHAS